jgi:predicted Zn-ribbon and HTH transcriptional regulator
MRWSAFFFICTALLASLSWQVHDMDHCGCALCTCCFEIAGTWPPLTAEVRLLHAQDTNNWPGGGGDPEAAVQVGGAAGASSGGGALLAVLDSEKRSDGGGESDEICVTFTAAEVQELFPADVVDAIFDSQLDGQGAELDRGAALEAQPHTAPVHHRNVTGATFAGPPPEPPIGGNCMTLELALQRSLDRGRVRLHPDFPATKTDVMLRVVQLKCQNNFTAASTMEVVNMLRELVPGAAAEGALPKDWKSFLRFVGAIGCTLEVIDQCRSCGYIYFSVHDITIQDALTCPRCFAGRFRVDELGRTVSSPCYLKLNFILQWRAAFRNASFVRSLVQTPPPPPKYVTAWIESPRFRAVWEMAKSEHFDYIIILHEAADGAKLFRGQGAKPSSVTFVMFSVANTSSMTWDARRPPFVKEITIHPKKPIDWNAFRDATIPEMADLFTHGFMVWDGLNRRTARVRLVSALELVDGWMLAPDKNVKGPTGTYNLSLRPLSHT